MKKEPKETIDWDRVQTGLGVRRRGTAVTWIVQCRVDGKTIRRRLAAFEEMTRAEARAAAKEQIAALRSGQEVPQCATVAAFAVKYLEDCKLRWKPATRRSHSKDFQKNILPVFGEHNVADLSRGDVADWLSNLTIAKGSKARCLAVLSGMMRHAEICELREPGQNPCKGMRRRKDDYEAQYLTKAEYRRVARSLEIERNAHPEAVAAIWFCVFTGCRKGEAIALRWDWLDGVRINHPDAKAGPRSIWMGKTARRIVAAQSREGEFIFAVAGNPISDGTLWKVWHRVRDRAKLPGLRLHDLRHSFAAVAISNGVGMRTLAGLLGHSSLSSTKGYAKFEKAAKSASAERVATHITDLLGGRLPERPAPVHKPRKRRSSGPTCKDRDLAKRFRKSRLGFHGFCEAESVDPAKLKRVLRADRKQAEQERGAWV